MSNSTYWFGVVVLLWYTFSIVFGRLYTGMHSFTDCTFGSLLGVAIWWVHMVYGHAVDNWLKTEGWEVPAIITVLAIIMIWQHPQPVDDCPCFEDAIACIAVVAGVFVGRWYAMTTGLGPEYFVIRTPGWQKETWQEKLLWSSLSLAKLVGGILTIAIWRIAVKFIMHAVLPPFFRALARIVVLPNRRFYVPATDYKKVPTEKALQPIPSVIDLPSTLHAHSIVNLSLPRDTIGASLKQRRGAKGSSGVSTPHNRMEDEFTPARDVEVVKHYDADVATKAIVYAGIGIIVTQLIPTFFEHIGVGLN